MQNEIGTVYIVKLERNLAHARYYVGWTRNLEGRMFYHRNKLGSRMLAACVDAGITFEVILSFTGTRTDERRIKNQKNTRLFVERYFRERGE